MRNKGAFKFGSRSESFKALRIVRALARAPQLAEALVFSRMAREASRFFTGDDLLSRACSAIAAAERDGDQAFYYDSAFDGGEFSGPACGEMTQKRIDLIEHVFAAATGDDFMGAVQSRLSPYAAHLVLNGAFRSRGSAKRERAQRMAW